jgi:hypothetical protein
MLLLVRLQHALSCAVLCAALQGHLMLPNQSLQSHPHQQQQHRQVGAALLPLLLLLLLDLRGYH